MYLLICCCHVFVFKQKTAYEMRSSDWSSDVCSSDLLDRGDPDFRDAQLCPARTRKRRRLRHAARGADAAQGAAELLPRQAQSGLGPMAGERSNIISPAGFAALRAEYDALLGDERPRLVETISWAAGNGDRSENGDYIYGRKRLREIDRRLAFLARRMKDRKSVV